MKINLRNAIIAFMVVMLAVYRGQAVVAFVVVAAWVCMAFTLGLLIRKMVKNAKKR